MIGASVFRGMTRTPLRAMRLLSSKVFDRETKRKQRDWSARRPDAADGQYVLEEVGWRLADKVVDLTRPSNRVLDIGCGFGHVSRHLQSDRVSHVTMLDSSEEVLRSATPPEDPKVGHSKLLCSEEVLDKVDGRFDLVLSSMAAHWINDLPGWFSRVFSLLEEDSPFIGVMLAEDTLFELRCSLQLAEMERLGGVCVHMSPLIRPADIGGLLSAAGFTLVTLDSDEIEVGYPDMLHLLSDLQLMGESACAHSRSLTIGKDILIAAQAIYQEMYSKEGRFPATFRTVSFIGWTPGKTTPKPAKRGAYNVSLKELSQ